MSAAIVQQALPFVSATGDPKSTEHAVSSQHAGPFDAVDLASVSTEEAYRVILEAASTTGSALITNLPVRPPIAAIQSLFGQLYDDPTLAERFNATYPKRGVFKNACLKPDASSDIDQKTTIDLSIGRLQSIHELDPTLVKDLGKDFDDIVSFYAYVEAELLPILTSATSNISGADLGPIHNGTNNHLRLIDYFPCSDPSAPRCGEHRDYNTYTIVFQDGSVGGLEFENEGGWTKVPASIDAVVSWGWCAAILSNDSIKAAKHRVLRTWPAPQRRTTAVVFVAPDLNAPLRPMGGLKSGNNGWCEDVQEGRMTVGAFKEVISKKWRRREGNEPGKVIQGAQDREIEALLKPGQGSN